MVDILPGSYCDKSRKEVRFCTDFNTHYTFTSGLMTAYIHLDHRKYWTRGSDPWIYIAPNELNKW